MKKIGRKLLKPFGMVGKAKKSEKVQKHAEILSEYTNS